MQTPANHLSSSPAARQSVRHVVVIGAGIVGVTTALRLAQHGHRVDVYEAASQQASGASYANAGLISPGHCFSWAEPGAIGVFIRSLFGKADGLGVTRLWSPRLWRWGWQFYRHSSMHQWEQDSRAALALSAYSRDVHFSDTTAPIALDAYGGTRGGILYLYQQGQQPRQIEKQMLEQAGEPSRMISGAALRELEPLLADADQQFDSGVFCAQDATGNAREFAAAAMRRAQELGVRFHFDTPVRRLITGPAGQGRIAAIETAQGQIKADCFVMTAGLASADLLAPLGYALPIYPVTGYSITFRHQEDFEPALGAVSLADKIAWAGFGRGVVRFTGFADIGPQGSEALTVKRFAALEKFGRSIYPRLQKYTPERWVGQRPMTPDGIPLLGGSRHANLLLNCGHGAMGWTMSAGCARIIADLVDGAEPEIECRAYRWDRFK
jgi:D-amino-acid dehydrogenase